MDIREAARQAIDEFNGSLDSGEYVSAAYNGTSRNDLLETVILRAFALTGFGWRDIAEAKKDGTVYMVWHEKTGRYMARWSETEEMWSGIGAKHALFNQPAMFHDLPSLPTKQTAEDVVDIRLADERLAENNGRMSFGEMAEYLGMQTAALAESENQELPR